MASKIPGWFKFGALYDSVVATVTDGATIVEVGCWKGRSAYDMASKIRDSGKRIRFVCVDHWHGTDEAEHREDPDVRAGTLYETFLRNVAGVREFLEPLRMDSARPPRSLPTARATSSCWMRATIMAACVPTSQPGGRRSDRRASSPATTTPGPESNARCRRRSGRERAFAAKTSGGIGSCGAS